IAELVVQLHDLTMNMARIIIKASHLPKVHLGQVLTDAQIMTLLEAMDAADGRLPVERIDFGAGFSSHLGKIHISRELLADTQNRCVRYLAVLVKGLVALLPDHAERLLAVVHFTPREALKSVGRPNFYNLPLSLADPATDRDVLKTEWDRLSRKDWRLYFGDIPTGSVAFRTGVVDYDSIHPEGNKQFSNIARFALRVLCLPISNAIVERAFSYMNAVKLKSRNKLNTQMLVVILRLRVGYSSHGCCVQFTPTQRMFELFTAAMYEVPPRRARAPEDHDDTDTTEDTSTVCADDEDWWDA
ncbi:Zinc finger protein 862, partial [Frankliniella fusca]